MRATGSKRLKQAVNLGTWGSKWRAPWQGPHEQKWKWLEFERLILVLQVSALMSPPWSQDPPKPFLSENFCSYIVCHLLTRLRSVRSPPLFGQRLSRLCSPLCLAPEPNSVPGTRRLLSNSSPNEGTWWEPVVSVSPVCSVAESWGWVPSRRLDFQVL